MIKYFKSFVFEVIILKSCRILELKLENNLLNLVPIHCNY